MSEELIKRLKTISNIKISEKIVYVILVIKNDISYIKIGSTIDIRSRLGQIKQEYTLDSLPEIFFIFEVNDYLKFERMFQTILQDSSTFIFYFNGKKKNGLSEFFNITEGLVQFFEVFMKIKNCGFDIY